MKNLLTTLAALLVFSILGFAAQKEGTYSGEIMDAACAKAGSHDAMMKKEGLKTAKDCTAACVKNGSKYVLFDKGTKKVYQLDDQTKPEQFAGDRVTVKGTLDATKNTIHVTDIEPAKGATKPKAASHPGL
jgi:Protein of unknown function (DUF5818)